MLSLEERATLFNLVLPELRLARVDSNEFLEPARKRLQRALRRLACPLARRAEPLGGKGNAVAILAPVLGYIEKSTSGEVAWNFRNDTRRVDRVCQKEFERKVRPGAS
jgi:hypothetical protein